MRAAIALLLLGIGACSSPPPPEPPPGSHADAGRDGRLPSDSATSDEVAAGDAPRGDAATSDDGSADASVPCSVDGNPGACIDTGACAALSDHTSTPGYCPGPADIECCTPTPNVADNPPVPPGYQLMPQSQVTPAMTSWAVAILDDPTTYPMFSTAKRTFGSLHVLARVEWHPPDFNNSTVHRGVTLYEPA